MRGQNQSHSCCLTPANSYPISLSTVTSLPHPVVCCCLAVLHSPGWSRDGICQHQSKGRWGGGSLGRGKSKQGADTMGNRQQGRQVVGGEDRQ